MTIPRLFRYSSVDYFNIRGLETQTLRLSPAGYLNDVFEGLSCETNDQIIKNIEIIADLAFVKSFSEDKSNYIMWAHYADSFKGMCVEYDFNHLDDYSLFHLFPVHYSKRRTNQGLEYTIEELYDLKKIKP